MLGSLGMMMTSTGKNGSKDESADPQLWQPMTCKACTKCFMDMETFRKSGRIVCWFGGPFHYEKVIDD